MTVEQVAETLKVSVRVCDDCALRYVDWWADEALWAKIVGRYEGSLCIDCFRVKCRAAGVVTAVVDGNQRCDHQPIRGFAGFVNDDGDVAVAGPVEALMLARRYEAFPVYRPGEWPNCRFEGRKVIDSATPGAHPPTPGPGVVHRVV